MSRDLLRHASAQCPYNIEIRPMRALRTSYFFLSVLLTLRLAIGLLGKFSTTMSYDSMSCWSIELHPTAIR